MVKSEIQNVKLRFGIIGNCEGLNRAIDVAMQVAPTDLSVLVTGESGVGKESFPQIIHQFSRRKHGPYIAVNCGAFRKVRLIQSCSDMKKEPLQEPSVTVTDTLPKQTVERFFWMRWENCLFLRRLVCCVCWKPENI